MKKTLTNQHCGEIIEVVIRRSNMSITEICRRIGVSRRSLYNWFDKAYLSSSIIFKIGEAIDHDFNDEFPEILKPSLQEVQSNERNEELYYPQDVSFWKSKYLNLLEHHHSLLQAMA